LDQWVTSLPTRSSITEISSRRHSIFSNPLNDDDPGLGLGHRQVVMGSGKAVQTATAPRAHGLQTPFPSTNLPLKEAVLPSRFQSIPLGEQWVRSPLDSRSKDLISQIEGRRGKFLRAHGRNLPSRCEWMVARDSQQPGPGADQLATSQPSYRYHAQPDIAITN
jgi:hypothetical protein